MNSAALGMLTIDDLCGLGYRPIAKRPVRFREYIYLLYGTGMNLPWCIYHAAYSYAFKTRHEALIYAAKRGWILKPIVLDDDEPLNIPDEFARWTIVKREENK